MAAGTMRSLEAGDSRAAAFQGARFDSVEAACGTGRILED